MEIEGQRDRRQPCRRPTVSVSIQSTVSVVGRRDFIIKEIWEFWKGWGSTWERPPWEISDWPAFPCHPLKECPNGEGKHTTYLKIKHPLLEISHIKVLLNSNSHRKGLWTICIWNFNHVSVKVAKFKCYQLLLLVSPARFEILELTFMKSA